MTQKELENRQKFLSPPTIQQIEEAVKKHNVSETQFERYFGVPIGTIKKVRMGNRLMPAKHWHLFLEPVNPQQTRPKRMIAKIGANMGTNLLPKSKSKSSKDGKINSLFS